MKLFVFELVFAGGLGPQTPPSLREEGWAMLAALVEDFDRVANVETLTLIERSCPRPLGRFCRRIAPELERSGFEEMVARADLVLVIAPEFDRFLAERSRRVLDAGKPLLGSCPAAIDLTGDKWALARHFTKHGIPSPSTTLLDEKRGLARVDYPFPAICKPRHGAGSLATFLIRDEEELSVLWARARQELPGSDFLLQPFASGLPASVCILAGPSGRLALEPASQDFSTDGRFHYLGGRLPIPEALALRARGLAERAVGTVAGLAGFVGVDLVLGEAEDGSEDWVIEINPRPTTSYIGLRQLAQDNLAEASLRIARGEEIAPIRWRQGLVHFSSRGAGQGAAS